MSEVAGKDTVIKISGAPTAVVGEATTSIAGNLLYQITNEAKRVLERTGVIKVHKQGANITAEAGTNTTNLHVDGHGLVAGDLICNTTRSNAYRLVITRVDADNVTVTAITGQTTGDTIAVYKTEAETAYTLNRLNGMVTYASAVVRVIKISGNYLPMTTAAYANKASNNKACDIYDITAFGDTYKKRLKGLKYASGSLSQFNVADTTYYDALVAGNPVVIEYRPATAIEPDRNWALLNSTEVAAAVEGVQEETVSWISHDAWLKLGA